MSEQIEFSKLEDHDEFIHRHIGPKPSDIADELKTLGLKSLDELIEKTIPNKILNKKGLDLPSAMSEQKMLAEAQAFAQKNKIFKSYITNSKIF